MPAKKVRNLRFDEFVAALRPDPKSKGDPLMVLEGFLGKSSDKGYVRVYFDETLNTFVDIAEKDILYAIERSKEVSPAGGSKLWLKADAQFVYGDPSEKERSKASFLQGDMTRAYEQQYAEAFPYPGDFGTKKITIPGGACPTLVRTEPCLCRPPVTRQETVDCLCPPITRQETTPCGCPPVTQVRTFPCLCPPPITRQQTFPCCPPITLNQTNPCPCPPITQQGTFPCLCPPITLNHTNPCPCPPITLNPTNPCPCPPITRQQTRPCLCIPFDVRKTRGFNCEWMETIHTTLTLDYTPTIYQGGINYRTVPGTGFEGFNPYTTPGY